MNKHIIFGVIFKTMCYSNRFLLLFKNAWTGLRVHSCFDLFKILYFTDANTNSKYVGSAVAGCLVAWLVNFRYFVVDLCIAAR